MAGKHDSHDLQHLRNLARYDGEIKRIYDDIIAEMARLSALVPGFNPDRAFSFKDYPTVAAHADRLFERLSERVEVVIANGVDAEWTLSNNKNSELSRRVFGDALGRLSPEQERRYFTSNDPAREAFKARKTAGLNLSDRVWRYTDQFREEIEMGLDLGLRDGRSAAGIARDLRRYLREPDRLFRRVRDEYGNLHLSRRAAAYHPGAGVYRSSQKNALRLARTEINMAYRTADYERWQGLDFVVGVRVSLSNNHPIVDICDDLQGNYPKTFKFTGWHPQCRCFAVPILKTEEELAADTGRILNGEPTNTASVNEITDVPENFKGWIADNSARIKRTAQRGTLPYFIWDNLKVVDDIINSMNERLMTSEVISELEKRGFIILLSSNAVEKYNESAIQGFDLLSFDKDLATLLKSKGIVIDYRRLEIKHDSESSFLGWKSENPDNIKLYYSGHSKATDERFSMIRTFKYAEDYRTIENNLFVIPYSLRKHGIAKEIFKISYNYYKPMGINQMTTFANKKVGGFVWGKYGYYAERETAENLIGEASRSVRISNREREDAERIISGYFRKNPSEDTFPMYLIAREEYGERLLTGTNWNGTIDFDKPAHLTYFLDYIGY